MRLYYNLNRGAVIKLLSREQLDREEKLKILVKTDEYLRLN